MRWLGFAAALMTTACISEPELAQLPGKAGDITTAKLIEELSSPDWMNQIRGAPHDQVYVRQLIAIFRTPEPWPDVRRRTLMVLASENDPQLAAFWPTLIDEKGWAPIVTSVGGGHLWTRALLEGLGKNPAGPTEARLVTLLGLSVFEDDTLLEFLERRRAPGLHERLSVLVSGAKDSLLRREMFKVLDRAHALPMELLNALAAGDDDDLARMAAEKICSAPSISQAAMVVALTDHRDEQTRKLGLAGAELLLQFPEGRRALDVAFRKLDPPALHAYLAMRAFERGELDAARKLWASDPLQLAALELLAGNHKQAAAHLAGIKAGAPRFAEVAFWPGAPAVRAPIAWVIGELERRLRSPLRATLGMSGPVAIGQPIVPLRLWLENRGNRPLKVMLGAVKATRLGAQQTFRPGTPLVEEQEFTLAPGKRHPLDFTLSGNLSTDTLLSAEVAIFVAGSQENKLSDLTDFVSVPIDLVDVR